MKTLHNILLSSSLFAVMLGCQSSDNKPPLVPEIETIQIIDYNATTSLYALTDTSGSADGVSSTTSLLATIIYSDGRSATTANELDWESNNSKVIAVSNGLCTALANHGSVDINASYRKTLYTKSDESKKLTIIPLVDVNISEKNGMLSINYDSNSTGRVDINDSGPYELSANGHFENNVSLTDISSNIIWTSSNTTVATVSSSGTLNVALDKNATVIIKTSIFNEVNTTLELNITAP